MSDKTVNAPTRNRRWFIYDQDELCVNKSQFVPVIFEPPCSSRKEQINETISQSDSFWSTPTSCIFNDGVSITETI